MGQNRVFGKGVGQAHFVYRYVYQSLTVKTAVSAKVLIYVAGQRAVGIRAAESGKQTCKIRFRRRVQSNRYFRLNYSRTFYNTSGSPVHNRRI